jgi:glycosyltransferase involved in cell wall biosynthesis
MNKSKKKICLVVASPLTIKFFLMGHIARLGKEYDLTVITNTDDPDFLTHLQVPVRVISLRIERNVSLWRDATSLLLLTLIFARERFDIVHSLSTKTGLLAMVSAWLVKVPARVHTFQGEVWATKIGFWRRFLKFLDKVVVFCSTHLLVVSQSEGRFLIEEGVVRPGQLTLMANGSICGVDVERFKPDMAMRLSIRVQLAIPEADLLILYVGRLNRDKGLGDLAKAFSQLSKARSDVHLLAVGPDEGELRQLMLNDAGSTGRLHFAEYTKSPEHYMAAADILCLPSYREGFGLVLIEAAATGLPTVASRIYGITDAVVDGVTGLLFEVKNVEDLAAKLGQLLDNPELRIALGENGRKRVNSKYSSTLVQDFLLRYYERILQK